MAQEYARFQTSVDGADMQLGGAPMTQRDNVNAKFEEQMKRGVDAAYRNHDEAEIARVISFANEEMLPSVVDYATDALLNLRQQLNSVDTSISRTPPEMQSLSPSPVPSRGRTAPPPPRGLPPPRRTH